MTARTPRSSSTRTLTALATAVVLSLTSASVSTAAPQTAAPAVERLTGTLADGAAWIADVPENWNGTLIVFSHASAAARPRRAPRGRTPAPPRRGYRSPAPPTTSARPSVAWRAPSATRSPPSRRSPRRSANPPRTLAMGQSDGRSGQRPARRVGAGGIDGALGLCGLVAGANDLHTYQLDAEYTIARLLLPDTTGEAGGLRLRGRGRRDRPATHRRRGRRTEDPRGPCPYRPRRRLPQPARLGARRGPPRRP